MSTMTATPPVTPVSALPFMLGLLHFPLIAIGVTLGGSWLLLPLAVVMAPFDLVAGYRTENHDPATDRDQLFWYRLITYLWIPLHPAILIYALWQSITSGYLVHEFFIMTLILGKVSANGITVGHELVHGRPKWERRVGEFILSMACLPHFSTDHINLHHVQVVTPKDLFTAYRGQSFYSFFPHSFSARIRWVWRFERDRLVRQGVTAWHYTNPCWRYLLAIAAWMVLFWLIGGMLGMALFVTQAFIAQFFLGAIDYVEHYGMSRVYLGNGRFERCEPRHSWNAAHRFSNWASFNLQRHSDHHYKPSRPYPLLQHYDWDEAPQLPMNYGLMAALALIPPLCFRIMNPRLDRWRAQFYPEITDWEAYDSPLFRARPEHFDLIAEIIGSSSRLTNLATRKPVLLDSIYRKEFSDLEIPDGIGLTPEEKRVASQGLTRVFYLQDFDLTEMQQQLAPIASSARDAQDIVAGASVWVDEKVFQVGLQMVRGSLLPSDASLPLSNIAESCISTVMPTLVEEATAAQGRLSGVRVALVALGDLGSREMTFDSPIDLLLVYDHDAQDADALQADSKQAQRVSGSATQLYRDIVRTLTALSPDGILYHMDSQRQPQGYTGPVACSLEELARYLQSDASTADHQAFTRARVVYAEGNLGTRFEEVQQAVLTQPREPDTLAADILATRERLERENESAALRAMTHRRGSLSDLESLAQFLQLRYAAQTPDILAGTPVAVFQAAGTQALTPPDTARELAEAATLWRNLQGILSVAVGENVVPENATPVLKHVIARACGVETFDALTELIAETATRTAQHCERLLEERDPAGAGTKDQATALEAG